MKSNSMRNTAIELVPAHMQSGLRRYIEDRIPPGDFMQAVLENDLREALGRADQINRHALFDIVSWLWSYAPADCWGSPEKVAAWLAERKTS